MQWFGFAVPQQTEVKAGAGQSIDFQTLNRTFVFVTVAGLLSSSLLHAEKSCGVMILGLFLYFAEPFGLGRKL